jgi:hypothetical protein
MEKKVLTKEQQAFVDKVTADLEKDRASEISHDDVMKWMVRAREQKMDTLQGFIKEIYNDIPLSYGNICHKMGIAAIATMYAFDHSEQGGITGFQSGCILWDVICAWTNDYDPQKLVHFKDMLYPQMEYKFTTISKETFAWIQVEAKKSLADNNGGFGMHPDVVQHQKNIIAGKIPFGYIIER